MSKKKFIPIYDLSKLPEDERNEYYLRACEHFNIPADLNLLELLWLDAGDSQRKLVLYAKKGATDILRGNLGISVDEMTKEVANDVVTFTAKGHDKTGRTDIATGASVIKNLSGQKLEFAYMTAQTRATRRLTLQFAGGGLLDESEVMAGVMNNSASPNMQAAIQPEVPRPNMEKGKDITEAQIALLTTVVESAVTPLSPAQMEAAAVEIATQGMRRSPRPRRVSLTPEFKLEAESPVADIPESKLTATLVHETTTFYGEPSVNQEIKLALDVLSQPEQAAAVLAAEVPPSPEQQAELRTKLYYYINVLGEAGMVPSEGVGGGYNKVKAFIIKRYPGISDPKELNHTNWLDLFSFFDEQLRTKGAKTLVKHIDSVVEAK